MALILDKVQGIISEVLSGFLNSCTMCVPLLLQSGYRSSADGVCVAEAPYRHEEFVVMAVPDERLHTDTLLEHHHGKL